MRRFYAKFFSILTYAAMFILALIFGEDQTNLLLIVIGSAVVLAILGHFLRCPECGRGQGRQWLFAEYCPYCGARLDD